MTGGLYGIDLENIFSHFFDDLYFCDPAMDSRLSSSSATAICVYFIYIPPLIMHIAFRLKSLDSEDTRVF